MTHRPARLISLLTLAAALGSAAIAHAIIVPKGTLRVAVNSKLAPHKLPREGAVPISVNVDWQISTTDGSQPPKLKTLQIDINRNGNFDYAGLPTCPYAKIQPASSSRALANCRSSLVGKGSFSAIVALTGQEPYEAKGRLLVFNAKQGKKPVLFGQIYSARPFANSFVIVFKVSDKGKGAYGTSLTATLPAGLRGWGNLTGIDMTLSRRYHYKGERRSFLSADCPAPKGFSEATFRLARTSFSFDNVPGSLTATVTGSCKVRG